MATSTHLAFGRAVFTYEVDGHPEGLLTGYLDDATHGFVLEHVIVFPDAHPSTLLRMVEVGMETAWEQGYAYVAFRIDQMSHLANRLSRLAERTGFTPYAREGDHEFWVRYKP